MRFLWLLVVAVLGGMLAPATAVAADDVGGEAGTGTGTGAGARAETGSDAFVERYRAVVHGGIVSAANTVVTCGRAVGPGVLPCASAQQGSGGRAADYDTAYVDVDSDPNTYNSSQAHLELPSGARVAYARLYWGANIRVGEQKPPADSGRVLIAEPRGNYKELLADEPVEHHDTGAYESFTASADVTELVRHAGSGSYTVGQLNVAMGNSPAGGWGGWSLVVAYEDEDEPLRELAIMDGLASLDGPGDAATVAFDELRAAAGGRASLGVVAFGGDRGRTGDSATVVGTAGDGAAAGPAGRPLPVALGNDASPSDDVMNSTISGQAAEAAGVEPSREPTHVHTFGFDADVFDVSEAMADRPVRRLAVRFASGDDTYQVGALFLQAEASEESATLLRTEAETRARPLSWARR
ncbi:DUF3344 domain-containing protein [Streptomyces sp. 4N509B]|uniref:DUF3344 domain-containing protein n=1 Tax=Streptomyces sp. 4N509B TaxID=3457413 RepID=UPI003FD10576